MDFRRQAEEEDDEEAVSYNPPTIRESAFSKPLLPSSSSLISGRGSVAAGAGGGVRNGSRPDPGSGGGQNALPDTYPATNDGRRGEGSNFPAPGSAAEPPEVRYRECLRNHAASLGGHVLDGCGEFMPSSSDTMKCAACCCHRSFHRREAESDHLLYHHHNGTTHPGGGGGRIPLLLPPPHPAPQTKQIHSFSASPSAAMVAFGNSSGGATTTESSSEELELPPAATAGGFHRPFMSPSSKKRFRTKFSSQQKQKMMDFAERIGWRIHRQDETEMERFCSEAGVSRQVFKVWMHNNKHSLTKQQQNQQSQQQQQPHI